jgi:hypothetical protein
MEGRRRLVELEHTVVSPPSSPDGEDMRLTASKFVDPARRLVKEDFLQVIVRRKKVPGGLTWEKSLEQKCLAISCSDKLFLVHLSFCLANNSVLRVKIFQVRCHCWLKSHLKTQLRHDAGNLRPNGVSSSLTEQSLILLQQELHIPIAVEKLGDLDVIETRIFQYGLMLFLRLRNELTVISFLYLYVICWTFLLEREKSLDVLWVIFGWWIVFLYRAIIIRYNVRHFLGL